MKKLKETRTPPNYVKKIVMYDKIKQLALEGLNKSQISRELGLDRSTVRKYLQMNESELQRYVYSLDSRSHKLSIYEEFIKGWLSRYPYLSSAQIEDRLKESYIDYENVHSKTVYNYVQHIRTKYNLPKRPDIQARQMHKREETEYEEFAEVGFGQYVSPTENGGGKRVCFFAMVLARCRQKYVWIQSHPLTSIDAVMAHDKAFRYFNGMPKTVVYDQDRLFIVAENLGDLQLTSEFRNYCSAMGFNSHFCRKADHQSKGKVENVIKYVKINFLPGRVFKSDSQMNEECESWLLRTGNGKKHASTYKIPHQQWLIEQPYLKPYELAPAPTAEYLVRRDNTINYKGNFYSLPSGTYTKIDTYVIVQASESGELLIHSTQDKLLAKHPIPSGKGHTVYNSSHRHNTSESLDLLKKKALEIYNHLPHYKKFIDGLKEQKKRYLRDNLNVLIKHGGQSEDVHIDSGFLNCINLNLYNSNAVLKYAKQLTSAESSDKPDIKQLSRSKVSQSNELNAEPMKSSITVYENLM